MKRSPKKRVYLGRDLEVMHYAQNYYAWLVGQFRRYIGEHIVEVGAGSGTFSQVLLRSTTPRSFSAIEPSSNMFVKLEKSIRSILPSAHLFNGFLSEHYANLNPRPDTFFYINVLEHVKRDDEEINLVYKCLKKEGHLCIFVPALQWLYGPFDRSVGHERRYNKRVLEGIVKRHGFQLVKSYYLDALGIIPWFIVFRVLKRSTITNGQTKLYDRIAVPIARMIEGYLKPPLGKNILLVARKV